MPPILDDIMTDPDRPVTRRELREELEAVLRTLATKDDLKAFATKEDLKAYPTRDEMNARFDELRTHFNVVAGSFKSEFRNLHDWVEANTNSLAARVEKIETGHGARLLALETRMTRCEARPRRR
jgi:hypothetical protein